MASSNDISVDIEVLACDKCSPHGNDYGCLRPGDSLEGLIRVSSPSALCFTDIEIFFQGLQSTLIRSAWAPNTNELGAYSPNYDHPVTTKSNYMVIKPDQLGEDELKDAVSRCQLPGEARLYTTDVRGGWVLHLQLSILFHSPSRHRRPRCFEAPAV
ncbi:hypothetical protein M3J09_013802 [Ascochyta lentis]